MQGCECCAHPMWGLCNGEYTIDDIASHYGYSIQTIQSGVNWDLSSDPETNAPMCTGNFAMDWNFFTTNQQGDYESTSNYITGNVLCGTGINPWEGYCPTGFMCYPTVMYEDEYSETFYSGQEYQHSYIFAECITMAQAEEIYNNQINENKTPNPKLKKFLNENVLKNRLQLLAGIKKPK